MAPTRLQRFFADDWPGLLAIWSWTIAFVGLIVAALLPGFRFDLRGSLYFAFLVVISILLAAMIGGILIAALLSPVYWLRERLNGAPFTVGDEVMILSRRHCGRVARVYEVWESRGQVRVGLGEEAKKDYADVFSLHQICRCSATPGSAPPSTSDSDQRIHTGC